MNPPIDFMKITLTRVVVAIEVFVIFYVPLALLAKLSDDVRNFGFLDFYSKAESEFPHVSTILWRLGPIAWWTYLAPLFLSIGLSCFVRFQIKLFPLFLSLTVVVFQATVILSAFLPYGKLYKVVGNPIVDYQDSVALMANILFVLVSLIFCGISIKLCGPRDGVR